MISSVKNASRQRSLLAFAGNWGGTIVGLGIAGALISMLLA